MISVKEAREIAINGYRARVEKSVNDELSKVEEMIIKESKEGKFNCLYSSSYLFKNKDENELNDIGEKLIEKIEEFGYVVRKEKSFFDDTICLKISWEDEDDDDATK